MDNSPYRGSSYPSTSSRLSLPFLLAEVLGSLLGVTRGIRSLLRVPTLPRTTAGESPTPSRSGLAPRGDVGLEKEGV